MSGSYRRFTRRSYLKMSLGLAAGALVAAACQPAPAASPTAATSAAATPAAAKATTGEKLTIQWWSHVHKPWNEELTRQSKVYVEENPSVEINYTTYPGGELVTKYTTAMLAGTGPTIVGAHAQMSPNFIAGGWIAEAPGEVVADIKDRFYPVCLDGATFKGKVYGYNQHIGDHLPIANVKVFEDTKQSYPTTWEELVGLADKIEKKEGDKLVLAVGNFGIQGETLFTGWGSMMRSYGGKLLSDDLKTAAFNTDQVKTVTKSWLRLVHPEMGAAGDIFGQGKTAILYSGPWMRPTFVTNYPDLKFKALPVLKGPSGQIGNDYVWNWLVSTKVDEKYKEESWKFTKWLNSTENQVSMVKASALIPTTKAAIDHPDVLKDEWVKVYTEQLQFKFQYVSKISNWAEVDKAISDEFALLGTGAQSIDDTLKKAETNVNKLLKESEIYA